MGSLGYVVLGAAAALVGGCVVGRPQAVSATRQQQIPDELVELSKSPRRDVWYPAVKRLGSLARTSDEMRAKVWSQARVNSVGMKFVEIQPGTFVMGPGSAPYSEQWGEVAHRVQITRGFFISVAEVTNAQFALIFPDHEPYARTSPLPDGPVVHVTWDEAHRFCELLSEREGVRYRLPTEAEWEYACRAGTNTTFCCGDDPASLHEYAWYGRGDDDAAPVASFKPNAWGIYDMHGNALEWVSDWYRVDTYRLRAAAEAVVRDPQGPPPGRSGHVLRGGYWGVYNPPAIASTKRNLMPLLDRPLLFQIVDPEHVGAREGTGFRVVRERDR
ncbi:MAG TPA: formylglycine-generating enzyme family protein [Phycisphaerae bacterium]|nr:formylglycine-generating enzyme family protein [Phycisphaerae bacterium]